MTKLTAVWTPLPPQRSPPSRSSTASLIPVDAPEGDTARPIAPDLRLTSASTVGLPLESSTWRPRTPSIALMVSPQFDPKVSRRPLRLGTPFNLVDGVTQFRRALTQHSQIGRASCRE